MANTLKRELKRLKVKETDPLLLHVRELRGGNVNEESHKTPLDSLPQAEYPTVN